MALPIALGAMMIVSMILVVTLELTASGERASNYASANQRAFSLAESGLNKAASVLAGSPDPSVIAALPTTPPEAENNGTTEYSASLSGLTWTITATGTTPNPIAGGSPIRRTVSAQYLITTTGTPWEWAYVDQPTGCMTIRNEAFFATPLYVNGDLCIGNNALYGASKLYVAGRLSTGTTGSVGTSASRIQTATIVGGCTGGVPNPHPCTSADRVWADVISQTPNPLSKPVVNLDRWYAESKPGPLNNCTLGSVPGGFDTNTTRNRSRPLFDLTPSTGYDCRYIDAAGNTVGQLTWYPSSGQLTVAGTVYFDGDIRASRSAVYAGRATLYASGTVTFPNNVWLCAASGCANSWDSSNNVLMLVAGSSTDTNGVYFSNNTKFQGAVYAVNNVYIDNNAAQWGPVVARSLYVDNNADQYQALIRLPPGAPGTELTVQPVAGSWRG